MNMEAIGAADHVEAFGMTETDLGSLATGYRKQVETSVDVTWTAGYRVPTKTAKEVVADAIEVFERYYHPDVMGQAEFIVKALSDAGYGWHILELKTGD